MTLNGVKSDAGRPVVGDREVLEPAARVADLHRHARQDFVLDGRPDLPVGRPDAPALHDLRVVGQAVDFLRPKLSLLIAPQKSPPLGAEILGMRRFSRSQSATKLPLASVQVRVTLVGDARRRQQLASSCRCR